MYHETKELQPILQQEVTSTQTLDLPSDTPQWVTAVRAAESKKAADIKVLDLREITSFADFFLICEGTNPKQIQAISDEIRVQLSKRGEHPLSIEGYSNADWILADYGDFLIHVFSAKARAYYDLERLWRHAKDVSIPAEAAG